MTSDAESTTPIEQLRSLCANAERSVVLVAPFMKTSVVAQLLDAAAVDVEFTLVTRWDLAELQSGVSDLDVWLLVKERQHSRLLIRPSLHAKVYVNERTALVGSANLTHAGTCGPEHGNLEILASVSPDHRDVRWVVEQAVREGQTVTQQQYDRLATVLEFEDRPRVDVEPTAWVPRFRQPWDLPLIYMRRPPYDRDAEIMSESISMALADIRELGVRDGLGEQEFFEAVAFSMSQQDVIFSLRRLLLARRSMRFGEVREWLSTYLTAGMDPNQSTQTLYRWIDTFLGTVFSRRRPGHSELLELRADP